MSDTNLRQILPEIKSVSKSTDKVILETEKKGTVVTDIGNIIFNKNNFEVGKDLDVNALLLGGIGDEMFNYVDELVNTVTVPEILALNLKSFTNSSGLQIGTNNIATTNLALRHFHVNTIRSRESTKIEYSKNASGLEDSLRDSGIDLSPGIYKVECVGSFTLAGPAGGFLINGESFGNGDRGYLSLELYNDTAPNEPLLVSTPIINFAPQLSQTEPPSAWCSTEEEWSRLAENFYISPGTQNSYMYGFISICQSSNIKLKAHTAGSYLIGYPFPDNDKDLPPAMYSPLQIIFEKITDDPFEFRIFGPEVNILTRVPQTRTTPPPILTTTQRPGTTTSTTTNFPAPSPSVTPSPTSSNAPSPTPSPTPSMPPSGTPRPTPTRTPPPTPTPTSSQIRRNPAPSPTVTIVNPLPSSSPRPTPPPTPPPAQGPTAGDWQRVSAGHHEFIVPPNVNYISMVAVGAGGGGAACNDRAASGGNGGDLRWRNNYPVTPNTKVVVNVGAGGSSAKAGIDGQENNGGNGGETIIKYGSNTILRAAGGSGGVAGSGIPNPNNNSTPTTSVAVGGGDGGRGGKGIVLDDHNASTGGGGGGAGGYVGPGGEGGSWSYTRRNGQNVLSVGQGRNGSGGGGGGGSTGGKAGTGGGGGGGVGLEGLNNQGNGEGGNISNGDANGKPGETGSPSGISQEGRGVTGFGRKCGGGGGGKGEVMGGPRGENNNEHGSDGGVRIIWGEGPDGVVKTFPHNAKI